MNITGENLGIVLGLLTLVTTLWVSARKVGSLETTIAALVASVSELSSDLKKQAAELQRNNSATEAIKVGVYGVDGNNGLRGELRQVQHDVRSIRQIVNNAPLFKDDDK